MYIDNRFKKDIMIVDIKGELDHHNAEEIRTRIDDWIDRFNCRKVILNLSGVTFMDSSGIGVVIGRYRKLSLKKGVICVTEINDTIKRVFNLSGLFKIVHYYEKLEEALKEL